MHTYVYLYVIHVERDLDIYMCNTYIGILYENGIEMFVWLSVKINKNAPGGILFEFVYVVDRIG